MKKKRSKKTFGYGPVIVLFCACVIVGACVIFVLVVTGDSNINMQSFTEGDVLEAAVQEQAEVESAVQVSETVTQEEVAQEKTSQENVIPEEIVPETYEFTVSDKSYFDDALFIGDSRTVGLREYGTLEKADYFASAGLNLYTIDSISVETEEGKKIKLEEMLSQNIYGKVYIMLGINELGYDFDTTVEKYKTFIDYIFTMQPDTILYVCANMHVNSLRNELDEIHNNQAINEMNEQIAAFADQKNIFYLDVNPLFDDENGNLAQEYISDDTHLMGIYYENWCEWYCQNTIVKRN